jgi:ATP-dependent DNA helicase RecQ
MHISRHSIFLTEIYVLAFHRQVPNGGFKAYKWHFNLPKHIQSRDGKILSLLNDGGWGSMVAEDRAAGRYRDELVAATVRLVKDRWRPSPMPTWAACVPSSRKPDPVCDFTRRLALKLGIPFLDCVKKTRDAKPQRQMLNRFHQCRNLDGAFKIQGKIQSGACLLVDDLVDSAWTMTVVAALLLQRRSGPVLPVALARVNVGD